MRTVNPWQPEELERLVELRKSTGLRGIALAMGRSYCSVRKKLRTLGLPGRPDDDRSRPMLNEPSYRDNVRALHQSGLSAAEIASRLTRGRSTIQNALNVLGLATPGTGRVNTPPPPSRAAIEGVMAAERRRAAERRQFASSNGWPEHLKQIQVRILNLLWEQGPMRRSEIASALRRTGEACSICMHGRDYLAELVREGMVNRHEGTQRDGCRIVVFMINIWLTREAAENEQ